MDFRWILGIFLGVATVIYSVLACNRRPQGASGDKSPVDDSFQITIEGNPPTFIPGQTYNVTLSCDVNFKFISFTLVVEPEPDSPPGYDLTGHFEIIDSAETRFSTLCENMIESSNTNIKNRIDVAWVAPTNPNSTCVYIKAAVLQHRNVWFMDDGFLTKRICAEEIDDINSQTPLVNPCCACDEAKYELVLERRWTRNTHAKYFPKEDWRTRFSEVVGASHTYDYRFWAYGTHASMGLKELAEHGATKTLEDEIKEHSETGSIRTIIRAPGITFRKNVMGTTLATVRVDPRRHMVSLVTKIIPSPDWILGVAGLELCLANCTWIEEKKLNLFPWDVGTDSGPSYESPDQQQIPADVVRRISSTFPSDYRSPFYDETGAPMKPMATLYIKRKKLYERECEPDDNVPYECSTHPWIEWSECSTKCGAGTQYRTRAYKDPSLAARYSCEVILRQTQRCVGTRCGLQDNVDDIAQNAECELMPWSQWSPCSNSCGRGSTKRTRDFRNPYAREKCQIGLQIELEQTKECRGNNCGGSIPGNYGIDNGGFDQYQYEPGLMEENNFTPPPYPTQRWRSGNTDRINERWDTSSSRFTTTRRPMFGEIDQKGYGINTMEDEGPDYTYPNSNLNYYGQNYPDRSRNDNNDFMERNMPTSNYPSSQNNQGNEEYAPGVSQFGNQRWISNNQNRYSTTNSKNIDSNYDNTFNTFNQNNANQYDVNRDIPPTYNQKFPSGTTENTNSRFISPGYHPPKKDRNTSTRADYTPSGYGTNAELGVNFDEYGNRILMTAGTNPDEYTVVQEYCFQKPYVVRRRCPGKKIISNYWFFDAEDRECKLFTTDNCDENKNKFRSLDTCEGTCLQPILNREQQQSLGNRNGQQQNFNGFDESQSQTRPNNWNIGGEQKPRSRNYGGYRKL